MLVRIRRHLALTAYFVVLWTVTCQPVSSAEVVRVNDDIIEEKHVAWEIKSFLKDRRVDQQEKATVRKQVIELLIRRQLVTQSLRESKLGATREEIDLEVKRLKNRLSRVQQTLTGYLAERGSDVSILRREFEWRIGWQRALEKYLTSENTAKYFKQHRRHFDGSRLHIAHILLKVSPQRTAKQATADLSDVRKQLLTGKLTFAKAAEQYSDAPTSDRGGDMGWIERRDPMPESFARPAFDLAIGDVSQPIETSFGVHLIRIIEHEPGNKNEKDVTAEVQDEMRRYLFDWIAAKMRKEAVIKTSPQ
jgi:parvulin-like peptidyl-prolyl isomerase